MDEYKPKDQIFEIHKLVDCRRKDQIFEIHKLVDKSVNNPKFSELFYDIRHKSYSRAWELYREQLVGDIVDQVFMSVTASLLAAAVETLFIATGILAAAARPVSILTYMGVYTLMTKFSIDRKLHEAESKERADTFYPVSDGPRNIEPKSLNEKNLFDRVLQDTMAAALIGHPGGYYTTVTGGGSGEMYTGHLLVSPPKPVVASIEGILEAGDSLLTLLWENFWSMGESDPDVFVSLDFLDTNLDFLLMTSELPFYNTNYYPYHEYKNTNQLLDGYNLHSFNTLGALETLVRINSGGLFDKIRPTCINGEPHYEFINSTLYDTVLPQSILYRPIVLSQARYDYLEPVLGYLSVEVRCKDYEKTQGVNAYNLNAVEASLYKAKIILNENGFEYPIKYVAIDVVKENDNYLKKEYFAQDILVNESDYHVEGGSIYFTKSIEALVSEKYTLFEELLSESWAEKLVDVSIYYKVRIVFDRFVPDTTKETRRLALAQATSHTIMDYFNQYTFAEVSANMISEIAYTETLTFWSTLISTPLIYFGSGLIDGSLSKAFSEAGAKAAQAGTSQLFAGVKAVISPLLRDLMIAPIKEVFQEIIEDGFREALIENLVSILGGTDDLGFWLSSLSTSFREVKGALGQITLGDTSIISSLSDLIATLSTVASGDQEAIANLQEEINQNLAQQEAQAQSDQEQASLWKRLIKSNFFRGLIMTIPAVALGSFNLLSFVGLAKMVKSAVGFSPRAYARFKAWRQKNSNSGTLPSVSTVSTVLGGMGSPVNLALGAIKKPSELSDVKSDLEDKFKDGQATDKQGPSLIRILRSVNADPHKVQRSELYTKLTEMRIANNFKDVSFATEMLKLLYPEGYGGWTDPVSSLRQWGVDRGMSINHLTFWGTPNQNKDLDVSINIGDNFEGLFPEQDQDMINYIYSKLFDPSYNLNKPEGLMDQVIYRVDLIQNAREFLRSTLYNGLWILKDGIINPKIYEILQNKFSNGEKFSKLEKIIADVASFYMGSIHDGESMPDGGYDSRLIKLYEEVFGEAAFKLDRPTKDFKDWYNSQHLKSGRGGDTTSPQFLSETRSKVDILKVIISHQLQHYSESGERLLSLKEASFKAGWRSPKLGRRYANDILEQIFKNPDVAKVVYSMIFGTTKVSYQKTKQQLIDNNLLMKTTSTEWFEMIKNRNPNEKIFVEVLCAAKNHEFYVRIDNIKGCRQCSYDKQLRSIQDVLDIGRMHNIEPLSFSNDEQILTEDEYNLLLEEYRYDHQNPDDYKSDNSAYIELRWRNPTCGHIFETSIRNIQNSKVKNYCPSCVSSIDQQRTLEAAEDLFDDYSTQPSRSNIQLSKFLPSRILLLKKYKILRHPNTHVDGLFVIDIDGKEIKVAFEHQGPQHYSFIAFLDMNRARDVARGIYRTDEQYKQMFDDQIERDKAKVELFKDLNKDGYYLIVVSYKTPVDKRGSFILKELLRQMGQKDISDFL